MSASRIAAGRRRAARVLVALAAATACLGAVVAYAATRPGAVHQGLGGRHAVQQPTAAAGNPAEPVSNGPTSESTPAARERLPRARLIETPPQTTAASDVQFRFNVQPRKALTTVPAPTGGAGQPPATVPARHFQCRVDGGDWSVCLSPHRLTDLAPGPHRFAVRAFNREERAGEPAVSEWQQTAIAVAAAVAPGSAAEPAAAGEEPDPKQFSVAALSDPQGLYPGLAPTPIPVRVSNPNGVPIEVTAITVAIEDPPASCGDENFQLSAAGVSPQAPLVVPAEGSADLPAAGLAAPAIRMLDLPVEQDSCRGAELPLVFSGEAHG